MVFTVCFACKKRLLEFYDFFRDVRTNLETLHAMLNRENFKKEQEPIELTVKQPPPPSRNYQLDYVKEEVVEFEEDVIEPDLEVEEPELGKIEEEEDTMVIEALEEAESLPEIAYMIKLNVEDEDDDVTLEELLNEPFGCHARDYYALLMTPENRIEYLKRNSASLLSYDRRRIFYGFKCYICENRYEEEFDLQQHLLLQHNMEKVLYKCCDTELTPNNQMDHISYHIDPEIYRCPICQLCFIYQAKLRRHFRGRCGKRSGLCSYCGEELLAEKLFSHQRRHEKKDESKPQVHFLKRPNNQILPKNPYTCDLCGRRFPKYCKIKYHIEMQHLRLMTESCNVCGKTFVNNYSLRGHMKLHEIRQTEECPICGRFVIRLERHIRLNHVTDAVICPECGKQFTNNLHYLRHKHKAHRNVLFQCEFCLKSFKDKTFMIEHRQTHLSTYLYHCDHCSYKANYKRNLAQHIKKSHYEVYLETKRARLVSEWGPTMAPKYARLEEVQMEQVV